MPGELLRGTVLAAPVEAGLEVRWSTFNHYFITVE